ncbi:MAG: hypothetical protein HS111_08655 [Kofleriaceae bacterium]|nr:hypothetical protein [Kofleriaceae bacterium]MCL4229034.1 hypothetical protein [Myxococcales bacterium]
MTADLAPYSDVTQLVRALAYAELRAVMLAWAGADRDGVRRTPVELVRTAIERALPANKPPWHPDAPSFGASLRGLIRTETAGALFRLAREATSTSWERPLAAGQLGDVPGLEVVFHHAGELAGDVRGNDPRSLAAAVLLTDQARDRASRLLGGDARRG